MNPPGPSRNGSGSYESTKLKKGDLNANYSMKNQIRSTLFSAAIYLMQAAGVFGLLLIPQLVGAVPAYAGIENMMSNLQSAILNVLAPMICVGGIIFAGFKLAMGDESAKRMLWWSCVGTVITFTAPSILSFLQTRVAS